MPEFMRFIDLVILPIFPLSPSDPPFLHYTTPTHSSHHQQVEMLGSAPGKVIFVLYIHLVNSWGVCMKQTQEYHTFKKKFKLILFVGYISQDEADSKGASPWKVI